MNWESVWSALGKFMSTIGLKLVFAVIVLIIGLRLIKWLKGWLKSTAKLNKLDSGVRSFLCSFSTIALYVVLFITVAMILGIPTTSFIAALASGFAAIGLAMQGALSNFAGGLMILIFRPFKVGDYISAPDAEGTVTDITVVYTILRTTDNKVVTVPNGILTGSVVKNYSAEETRRVDLDFSTAYDCDVDKVKGVLMDIINAHPRILRDPEPFARLAEHGDSALTYSVRVWCKTEDYWDVAFDLKESVKKKFDENGISIPYPQLDIHFDGGVETGAHTH